MRKILPFVVSTFLVASACGSHDPDASATIAAPAAAPATITTPTLPTEPTTIDPACEADPVSCDARETSATPTTTTPKSEPMAGNLSDERPPSSEPPAAPQTDPGGAGEVVSCDAEGNWPHGASDPTILVRWTGTSWEYEGPQRLEAARTQVAFEYHRGSPGGVYVAVVGLIDGRTPADFLEVARDQELGRYHVRRGNGAAHWDVPDWIAFVGSLEHGCVDVPDAPHRVIQSFDLPAGHYILLGHSSPAAGATSLAVADVIAEVEVVRLRVSADGSSIRLTQCHDPHCTDKHETRIRAPGDCAHRVEAALGPTGNPRLAYVTQPDGDPLCGSNMEEWTGEVRLIECLDPACAAFTDRTLAEVEYLWAGPYDLDTAADGTFVLSWYVASSGHPVSEVTLVTAACDPGSCDVSEVSKLRPWNINY